MDFYKLFEKTFHQALKLQQGSFWCAEDFCHYTSLHGLMGIISNNELWLSDHRFVNDKLEYEYGKQLAITTIAQMADSENDKDFHDFLQRLLKSIENPSGPGIYIGSMSHSPDKLDQWKGYGNSSESVCIVFSGDYDLWNGVNSHPTHIRQQQTVYDECEQKNLIRETVRIFKENFEEFRQFDHPFLRDVAWLIESMFILFKHKEYASEDELRLTIMNLNHILESKKPGHRIARGMVIPYITTKYISTDVDPSIHKLPIKEIIVSPTSGPDLLRSVKVFVENMGYKDIKVVESKIKFRG